MPAGTLRSLSRFGQLRYIPFVVLEINVVAIVDGQAVEDRFTISYAGFDLLVAHADLA